MAGLLFQVRNLSDFILILFSVLLAMVWGVIIFWMVVKILTDRSQARFRLSRWIIFAILFSLLTLAGVLLPSFESRIVKQIAFQGVTILSAILAYLLTFRLLFRR